MTEIPFRVAQQSYDEAMPLTGPAAIKEHPENYNEGADGIVAASLDSHGFYGGILVQRSTGYVIAGNTRYRVAMSKSAASMPGFWLDVDDDEAREILAVDNGSSRLSVFNASKLLALVMQTDESRRAAATSFSAERLAQLARQVTLTQADSELPEVESEPITFGVYDISSVVAAAFAHYRRAGLPQRGKLTVPQCMQEINALAALDSSKLAGSTLGYAVADTYHAHRFDARVGGKRTVAEVFAKDEYLTHALQLLCTGGSKISDASLLSVLGYVRNAQVASNFRPAFALSLLRRFAFDGATVLDTSTGYGGRLVGFLASECGDYIGIDPNTVTHAANERMAADLMAAGRVTLHNLPAEDVELPGGCADFAFTSPPYFAKEIYSDEPTQSCNRYTDGEQWRSSFLVPTLALQYRALKPGRFAVVNIADVRVGSVTYPLAQWTIDAAQSAGFRHIRTEQYPLSRVPGRGEKRVSAEPVLIFGKD